MPPRTPSGNARKAVKRRGVLASARVRAGTASEHESWVIDTDDGERLILTPARANPFLKAALPFKAGTRIEVRGYLLDGEIRSEDLTEA